MEIDILKYLDKEEIKSIIESEIRQIVKNKLQSNIDFERIFSNSAYHIIFKEVDLAVDNTAKNIIKQKTLEILNSDWSTFNVFQKPDNYSKGSVAYNYMSEVVKDNFNIIKETTITQLSILPKKYITGLLKELFIEKLKL